MFYVYVDWTEEERSRPYYVGKGNADRVSDLNVSRNPHHTAIVHQFGQQRRVHFEARSESEALAEETRLMLELRTVYGRTGHFGANIVIGGAQSGSHGSSPFQRLKCVHVKFDRTLHSQLKSKTFELGTTMQTALEVLAGALASNDPHVIELLKRELLRRR